MKARDPRISNSRLLLLGGAGLLWAFILVLRLIHLQFVRHAYYLNRAENQQFRARPLPAPRGLITDRNGRLLAMSQELDTVFVDPRQIPAPDVAAGILAGILGLDAASLQRKLEQSLAQQRYYVVIKKAVSPEQSDRLRSLGLSWIHFRPEIVRHYPKGSLAAHLIGAVNAAQSGAVGLEYALDRELGGRDGSLKFSVDAHRRAVETSEAHPPEPGASLLLTIDERIQFLAERELETAIRTEGCASGSVVVMEPESGEILALASYPSFDPNQAPRTPEEFAARFHNHAVSVPFEPGSVFKIVTLAAALETTDLRPESVIPCGNGRITLYGRTVRDHHPYAALPLADVLAKSSNIGAIQIGLRVGERRMAEYVRRFGFGQRTGVPLPAESPGRVRDLKAWQKTSLVSIAMGHEISATTLQLARAVAVIANGGWLVQPKLILGRRRPDGAFLPAPSSASVRVLKPETAFLMRRLMEGVVLRGTGQAARLDGYSSAGKTGTAQIYDPLAHRYTHRYNSTFAGFAPVTRPRLVIVVTLNGARQFGGAVSAPVFRRIAMPALRLLNVPPDLPETPSMPLELAADTNDLPLTDWNAPPEPLQPTDSLAAAPAPVPPPDASAARTPDFQGKPLPTVLREALAAGLELEIFGRGLAREQFPPPGSPLDPGARVRVVFRP